MIQAKDGDVVKIHYTGKLEDGTVFETSIGGEPIQLKIGDSQLIRGLDQALIGMKQNEAKSVTVPSNKAYGPYNNKIILQVSRNQFPSGELPEVGQQLEHRLADGQLILVRVTDITESYVTLDSNHPLAGKDLIFDILLLTIN